MVAALVAVLVLHLRVAVRVAVRMLTVCVCVGQGNTNKKIRANTRAPNNHGFDDERGDYKLVMRDHLGYRFEVLSMLGKGSFGQVVRCLDYKTGQYVAVKIIRNKKRFHQQVSPTCLSCTGV